MRAVYAGGARDLLELRRRGQVPTGPVVVTMVGDEWDVPTLRLYSDLSTAGLDWRMLVNLEVWLWANASVPLDRILDVAMQIAAVRPKTLFVRFEHAGRVHDVQIGDGFHLSGFDDIPAIHEFHFCISNNTGSKFGASMRRALMNRTNGLRML
jgi:hypothetical protein